MADLQFRHPPAIPLPETRCARRREMLQLLCRLVEMSIDAE